MIFQILFTCFLLLESSLAGYFSKNHVLVRNVKYKRCAAPNIHPGIVEFRDVSAASTADGALLVSGAVSSAINLTAPIQVKVNLHFKKWGLEIPLPCIRNFGSCTYNDVCDLGVAEDELCPGALDENDVPCRCPIPEGLYSIPGAQFPIAPTRWANFISGYYGGTMRMYNKGRLLSCYQFIMQLQ